MKKNKMMRIASVLLVAVLLTTCAISGTYAKYTSKITASDKARVAKWDFQVGSVTANDTNKFTFNLFETVNDYNGDETGDDQDVANATDDFAIIAPGTSGSFKINLKNASEVNATFTIDFTLTNDANIPVEFKVGDGEWKKTLDNVASTALDMNAETSVTVEWRWAFEQTDVDAGDQFDTSLGLNGTYTLEVAATVTATQVN